MRYYIKNGRFECTNCGCSYSLESDMTNFHCNECDGKELKSKKDAIDEIKEEISSTDESFLINWFGQKKLQKVPIEKLSNTNIEELYSFLLCKEIKIV